MNWFHRLFEEEEGIETRPAQPERQRSESRVVLLVSLAAKLHSATVELNLRFVVQRQHAKWDPLQTIVKLLVKWRPSVS